MLGKKWANYITKDPLNRFIFEFRSDNILQIFPKLWEISDVTGRTLVAGFVLLALTTACLFAQTAAMKPEDVVRQWFDRWNKLDGSPEATARLLELYRSDAFHQIGPTEKQIGEVRFEGQDKIRKMIDDFAKANTNISFGIQSVTGNEKAAELIHTAEGPWGGQSVAVQYAAAYTVRKDNRRWMYPGAAFFQLQDGKIRGVRFYMARDEMMEVVTR
jgi:ketosteroid isomerase-like protein